MNLYNCHSDKKSLYKFADAVESVPRVAWDVFSGANTNVPENHNGELKKRAALFATDPVTAYRYADKVLGGPFPAGEAAIAKDPRISFMYAGYILKARFPKGEKAILKDLHYAMHYTARCRDHKWPELVAKLKTPMEFADYAIIAMGERWPEAEHIIAKDLDATEHYIDELFGYGERFELGEDILATNPQTAFSYAVTQINKPFHKGEPAIAKVPNLRAAYNDRFYEPHDYI